MTVRPFFLCRFGVALALTTLVGCAQPQPPLELTFNRGAQLLAAGSPKSAIPFLTQTIASVPDGPEPPALLALAYALDLQSAQAIQQARSVKRPEGAAPGWEGVAIGIAEMTRHRPGEAIAVLQRVVTMAPPDSKILPAARQWLTMAYLLKGDHLSATATIETLAKTPAMKSTTLLWTALIRARDGKTSVAADVVMQAAMMEAVACGRLAFEGNLDDQSLYDGAIAATAVGKFDMAQGMFAALQLRNPDAGDAAIWLALVNGAQGNWQASRKLLADSCDKGSAPCRGLANQLFALVAALEDRPEAMVEHLLAGQRQLGRENAPAHVVEQPKPESVWYSDSLK